MSLVDWRRCKWMIYDPLQWRSSERVRVLVRPLGTVTGHVADKPTRSQSTRGL